MDALRGNMMTSQIFSLRNTGVTLLLATVGDKTASACNSYLRRRAWWYCTADDVFLWQG
jgi:hypothetical protein